MCQRLDPDRNGFISTSSVVRAFELLTPLLAAADNSSSGGGGGAGGGRQLSTQEAEFHQQLLLSICTDALVRDYFLCSAVSCLVALAFDCECQKCSRFMQVGSRMFM